MRTVFLLSIVVISVAAQNEPTTLQPGQVVAAYDYELFPWNNDDGQAQRLTALTPEAAFDQVETKFKSVVNELAPGLSPELSAALDKEVHAMVGQASEALLNLVPVNMRNDSNVLDKVAGLMESEGSGLLKNTLQGLLGPNFSLNELPLIKSTLDAFVPSLVQAIIPQLPKALNFGQKSGSGKEEANAALLKAIMDIKQGLRDIRKSQTHFKEGVLRQLSELGEMLTTLFATKRKSR